MTEIKRRWVKNLTDEEQIELLRARHERAAAIARESARKNKLKTAAKKYGITEEELVSIINASNGVCSICTGPLGDKLNIDHCHQTGKVRNVLCASCNNGLGQFKDSIETLKRLLSI